MAINEYEDQFHEEVLGLFAREAEEWIGQIQSALVELEGQGQTEPAPKLFDTIRRGLTNLGGSAATVELPGIEQVTLALLRLLQTMQQAEKVAPETGETFREALGAIATIIRDREVARAGSAVDLSPVMGRIAAACTGPAVPVHEINQSGSVRIVAEPSESSPARTVLDVLMALRLAQGHPLSSGRNLVDVVLREAGRNSEQATGLVERQAVADILKGLEAQDERFLAEMERGLPRILQTFPVCWLNQADGLVQADKAKEIFQDIQRLREAARAVEAAAVEQFFAGLETFLQVTLSRRISVLPERLNAVQARLEKVMSIVRHWIELGQVERTAIEKALGEG